jgi:hypothetical protein
VKERHDRGDDYGYVLCTLDHAWAEAERALPDGWAINMLWGTVTEDRWAASAGPFPSDDTHARLHVVAGGPTPAAALTALAAKLRTAPKERAG